MLKNLLRCSLMLFDPLLQNTLHVLNDIEVEKEWWICIVMQAYFVLVSPRWVVLAASSVSIVVVLTQNEVFLSLLSDLHPGFNMRL